MSKHHPRARNGAPALGPEGIARLCEQLEVEQVLDLFGAVKSGDGTRLLGRFRLGTSTALGVGGFGIVLLADDPEARRPVALKLPRTSSLSDPLMAERFRRDFEAAGALDHPGIVPVLEVGSAVAGPYLVMAFVPGPTLERWLRGHRRAVPVDQAVELVVALADAVQHAHERGVLHCDLKPGNVLLDPRGGGGSELGGHHPRIVDFGLARLVGRDPGLTRAHLPFGTPPYMAPEQAQGSRRDLTARCDVHALAAILYELLTGAQPYAAGTADEKLAQLLNPASRPAPPRALRPDVPRDLEAVVLRGLEKEPGRRYAGARELADDLRRFREGRPTKARPLGPCGRCARWARRRPAAAALLLLGALGAATFLAGWLHFTASLADEVAKTGRAEQAALRTAGEAEASREAALALAARERAARGAADAARDEAEEVADALRLQSALDAWRRHDLVRARALLAQARPRFATTWEQRHVEGVGLRKGRLLSGHRWGVRAVAFTHGGARVAAAAQDRHALCWGAGTGEVTSDLHWADFPLQSAAFSADGRRLVLGGEGKTALVCDAGTGEELFTLRAEAGASFASVAFSADRKRVVSAHTDGTVRVWSAFTGELGESTSHGCGVRCAAFSPDRKRVAFGDEKGAAWVWEVDGALKHPLKKGHNGPVLCVAFSPDGRRIATGGEDGAVVLFDSATRRPIDLKAAPRHRGPVGALAFSPDGRRLASGGADALVRVSDAATGEGLLLLRGHAGAVLSVAFSADGRRLASGDTAGQVWAWGPEAEQSEGAFTVGPGAVAFAPDGGRALVVRRGEGAWLHDTRTGVGRPALGVRPSCAAFSRDGKLIVSGTVDGEAHVWDAGTGARKRSVKGHLAAVTAVALAPDGRWAASADEGGAVRVWDAATGQQLFTPERHLGAVHGVAFSPDGERLAYAGAGGRVVVWGLAAGRRALAVRADAKKVYQLAFSPDGRWLVTGGGDGARVWCAATGAPRHGLAGGVTVTGVAYSADGRRVATAGEDGLVRTWDAGSGRARLALEGHAGGAGAVAFSADGARVLSAGGDGKVRVWVAGR